MGHREGKTVGVYNCHGHGLNQVCTSSAVIESGICTDKGSSKPPNKGHASGPQCSGTSDKGPSKPPNKGHAMDPFPIAIH